MLVDLVADGAYLVEGFAGAVGEVPVEVALAGECGAGVAAASSGAPGTPPGAGRAPRSTGPSALATPPARALSGHRSFFGSTPGIVLSALAGLLVAAAVALLLLCRRRSV